MLKRGKDLTGNKYDRLTVISYSHKDKKRRVHWNCLCVCGNEVVRRTDALNTNANYKSCGCYTRELQRKQMLEKNPNKTHGMSGTRIYKIYRKMHERCYDENYPEFHLYGGRGIRVCNEWRQNFNNFYEWSKANGYENNLSIDRIDTNKGYSPNNCRWADKYQQANNKRNNITIEHNGKTLTLSEWATELNLPVTTLRSRYYRGKSTEEVLFHKKLRN